MPAAVPQETAEPHAVARSVWTLVSKTSHHYTVTIGHTRKLRYRQNLSTCPPQLNRQVKCYSSAGLKVLDSTDRCIVALIHEVMHCRH